MNILLISRAFYPSIGGLESVSLQLAEAWKRRGHNVRVVTITPLGTANELDSIEVVRQPHSLDMLRLTRWCDVCVHSGISLRNLWSAAVTFRPVVFIHHAILDRQGGRAGLQDGLKRLIARSGTNVAVSGAVAAWLPKSTTVIHNPFRVSLRSDGSQKERAGVLFVGRLVPEKGCDVAIDAVALLHKRGEPVHLTICGDGPERGALEQQVDRLGLGSSITFRGWADADALARLYASAEVVVIPSRNEPFGVVALEALAGGSVVVCSNVGGLSEAVGDCGLLFTPGDAAALADRIAEARIPATRQQLRDRVGDHLRRFDIEEVAGQYLDVLEHTTRRRR